MQEQNSIALQDIAEFTVQHVEVESYIKKLLIAQNIELPSITLFSQSQGSSRSNSNTNSSECLPKSTNRESYGSSKGSIGNVVNIEPDFESMFIRIYTHSNNKHLSIISNYYVSVFPIQNTSRSNIKQKQPSTKASIQVQSMKKTF